jgi:hypothetical protein
MSPKQRAARAAAGEPHPTSTFRRKPPKRTGKRPTATGPDQATVALVLERDGHQCTRCGLGVSGDRGVDWSIQHRRARGSGGTCRPDANAPQALILLCGSATTLCHGWVESHRAAAEPYGWAIKSTDDPLTVPVRHSLHGWVLLDNAGTTTRVDPPTDLLVAPYGAGEEH